MKRQTLIVIVSLIVAAALIYGFLPEPVSVDAAKVSRGDMVVSVEEEAKTRVRDRFVISAPVTGYMRRVRLEAGDAVKKGQAVAVLEPLRAEALDPRRRAEAEAQVAALEAALKTAQEKSASAAADAAYANTALERSRKLFSDGLISVDELDRTESVTKQKEALRLSAEAAASTAAFELERARATLHEYAADGGKAVAVISPAQGRVLKVHKESSGVIGAGEPIMDVGNPDLLEVWAEVLSTDAVRIKPGNMVVFERWGGGKPLSGRVKTVEPQGFTKVSSLGVEEQRVLVISEITSPRSDWQELGDGYSLEESFILWEGKEILQVPAGALFRVGDRWAVFVIDDERARLRMIEAGHRNGLIAEIISGLSEGESVIVHPDDAVEDGGRVRLR